MSNFYGELLIRITSDTAGLSKGLAQASTQTNAASKSMEAAGRKAKISWERVGLGMQNVGRTMTQFVTLPIAAGFAFATYSGYKYSKTLLQIRNLTGLTAEQTERYGEAMLNMSKYGIGPQKLAESMYFISSSGFKAAEALKVLDVVAKASASGMGDIEVMADVVTSALNSYGHAAYSAAEVTDILMKTVEVGKAEPEQLASSLGRILPIANQLGIGFEELGGNVAALTLGGLSAAESVTALRGTMVALVSPAQMSIKELKTMGLSYQDVTKSIADKGLLPTLKMLWEATDHNMLSLRKIIPNIRATSGVMSLLGANYKKNLDVIDQVSNAQGKLNETYETTSLTPIQKFRQAIASIQASFIRLGIQIMPTVASLVPKIGDLFESIGNLSPNTRGIILWGAAFVGALGPAIMIAGSLIRSIALIRGALSTLNAVQGIGAVISAFRLGGTAMTAGAVAAPSLTAGFSAMTAAAGPLKIALLGVAAAAAAMYGTMKLSMWLTGTTERVHAMRKAVSELEADSSGKLQEWADRVLGGHLESKKGVITWKPSVGLDIDEQKTGLVAKWVKSEAAKTHAAQAEALQQQKIDNAEASKAWFEQQAIKARSMASGARTEGAHELYMAQYDKYIAEAEKYGAVVDKLTGKMTALTGKNWRLKLGAHVEDLRDAIVKQEAKVKAFADGPHNVKMDLKEDAARRKLESLKRALASYTGTHHEGLLLLKTETAKNRLADINKALKNARAQAEKGVDVGAKIDRLLKAKEKASKALKALQDQKTNPNITANNSQALNAINQVKNAMGAIQNKNVTIHLDTYTRKIPRAHGGVDLVTNETTYVAGEKGVPEIAAFFPMNDPSRSANLLDQLNTMMGESGRSSATASASAGSRMVTEEHYHYHMPGGSVLVGTMAEAGKLMAPHTDRVNDLAYARHGRGR